LAISLTLSFGYFCAKTEAKNLGRRSSRCRLLSSQIVIDKDENQDTDYDEKECDKTRAESKKSRNVEKLTMDEWSEKEQD